MAAELLLEWRALLVQHLKSIVVHADTNHTPMPKEMHQLIASYATPAFRDIVSRPEWIVDRCLAFIPSANATASENPFRLASKFDFTLHDSSLAFGGVQSERLSAPVFHRRFAGYMHDQFSAHDSPQPFSAAELGPTYRAVCDIMRLVVPEDGDESVFIHSLSVRYAAYFLLGDSPAPLAVATARAPVLQPKRNRAMAESDDELDDATANANSQLLPATTAVEPVPLVLIFWADPKWYTNT